MLKRLILLLSLLPGAVLAEQVYRQVDEDGVPTFSDQGAVGAETIEIQEPMTFSNEEFVPARATPSAEAPEEARVNYRLEITSPANDSAIRENSGALSLYVSISLRLAAGHRAEMMMDGRNIRPLKGSGSVALSNLDRGTHAFSIRVLDERGKVAAESSTTSVTILRHALPRKTPKSS